MGLVNKPVLCPGNLCLVYTKVWVLESWFKSVCVCACMCWEGFLFICLLFHFLCQDSSEDTPAATQNFIIPKKEIHTVPDMGKWKRSQVPRGLHCRLRAERRNLGFFKDTGFLDMMGRELLALTPLEPSS